MRYVEMILRSLFILLVLWLPGCQKAVPGGHFHASDVTGKYAGANFRLSDHNGRTRTLKDFKGKVVVLFFGYTHCPDVCPTTLADLAQTVHMLGKDAGQVQVLFITIDPERDTREVLAKFVPAFDPDFLGLYGDVVATANATRNFMVDYQKHAEKNGYSLDHTTFIYVLDQDGRVRLLAGNREPPDWLAADIRLLLASGH
jgi:protein SCO1/2